MTVAIPVLVFLACFGGAIVASARWLPDLGPGRVGGLAFFVVVGLIGAAAGILGLDVYSTVREIEFSRSDGSSGLGKSFAIASGIHNILFDSGALVASAGIVYLLAPPADDELSNADREATTV